jgi:hypothetical protein
LDHNERPIEISYQVISNALDTLTVAFFVDNKLLHIISGNTDVMLSKINRLFH